METLVEAGDLLSSVPELLRPAVNLYFCALPPSLVVKVTEAPAEGESFLRFQLFLS